MVKHTGAILDTESTGVSKEDQVIELAYFLVSDFSKLKEYAETLLAEDELTRSLPDAIFNKRYKPSADINPFAYEVHGLTQEDLKDCLPAKQLQLEHDFSYAIAHNAAFDKRLLRQTMDAELHGQFDQIKWICTVSLAKIFDKELKIGYENHKLDTVVKHHFPEHIDKLIQTKHQALSDCVKLLLFLSVLVEQIPTITNFSELYNFQEIMKKVKK